LGLAYISGKVVAQDEQLGLQYIEASASSGVYPALFFLGIQDKEKGDFPKAEVNLVKALNRAESDEEANDVYNELGNIWEAIWKSTQKQENYQLALQLFQKAKIGGHANGNLNYSLLEKMLPNSYPSLKTLLSNDLLLAYFETVNKKIRETLTQTVF
jgi:tetratricopeptide (TPR) repeat protein